MEPTVEIKRRIFINGARHWAWRHFKRMSKEYHPHLSEYGVKPVASGASWGFQHGEVLISIWVDGAANLRVEQHTVAKPKNGSNACDVEASFNEFKRMVTSCLKRQWQNA